MLALIYLEYKVIAQATGIACGFVFNYLNARFFVFLKARQDNKDAIS